jgi:DNA transposition AAA+ family ATPase
MREHKLSQEDMASHAGVNVAYINALANNRLTIGKANAPIKDGIFRKIARSIGCQYEAYYWGLVETEQYELIMEELQDSKMRGIEKMIIGETGCGKTYTLNRFKKEYPAHNYCVTVSSLHSLNDILNDLCEQMNLKKSGRAIPKLAAIAKKLGNIRMSGAQPVIIIDEAENLKPAALRMIKALYDALEGLCPVTLIGTPKLILKLDQLREADEDGMPQLYRRYKAGVRHARSINREAAYPEFLSMVEDQGLRTLLMNIADNYGELNRYLEPALRESEAMGEPLTERFFRLLHKL